MNRHNTTKYMTNSKTLPGKSILIALPVSILLATAAHAETSYADDAYQRGQIQQGRVLNATPIYQTVRTPQRREVCWDEEVTYREPGRRSRTGPIVGTIIGGAIGNQFGGGHGRDALTVAGALLGRAIAKDAADQGGQRYTEVETRCRTETDYVEQDRLRGYNVEYEYNGQVYNTRTRSDPGDYIDLRVSVTPVSD